MEDGEAIDGLLKEFVSILMARRTFVHISRYYALA